jgi:LCP family protein required for cell wall assembly
MSIWILQKTISKLWNAAPPGLRRVFGRPRPCYNPYSSYYMGPNGTMRPTRFVRERRPSLDRRLVWGLLAAFLVAALATAYMTFILVRSVVATYFLPPKPKAGAPPAVVATAVPISPKLLSEPLQSKNGPAPKEWDGKSRLSILVMGLDYRDWEDNPGGPSRTDTMILFTIDPATRSAGMLSIPRDLWVSIPGFDPAKINSAYFIGDVQQVPGGGAGLAMKTVSQFLGVPVDYYAVIDFTAFEKFINELGGIQIDIPEKITVDPIGPHNTVTLKPGPQMLDGPTALAYARDRYTEGNDFDRSQRQQQVIMAVRDRIMNLNMLPTLIQKSPILVQNLASGVHSNLTLQQMISIAWLASQIPKDNIKKGAIGPDQVVEGWSYDGQQILEPKTDEIRALRDQVFSTDAPVQPMLPTGDPKELSKQENAKVSISNGTTTTGLAARTKEYLVSQGIDVTATDNAQQIYDVTTIIDYTGKPNTRQYLAQLLNVKPANIFSRYDPNSTVDIAILLGGDWAQSNPMP